MRISDWSSDVCSSDLDYSAFAKSIGIDSFVAMPISGFKGDNITSLSPNTPWYTGPALIEHLETVPLDNDRLAAAPFRMEGSEGRRVGKECVRTCRSRGSPVH